MLTILTGAPGAGKTCALVSLLMGELNGRPLYADGVNGLQLDHEAIDVNQWHEVVPRGIGAVVAVDEGQRRWRPRGPGQKVPPSIEAMETHRHDGLDFFVTTQLVILRIRAAKNFGKCVSTLPAHIGATAEFINKFFRIVAPCLREPTERQPQQHHDGNNRQRD